MPPLESLENLGTGDPLGLSESAGMFTGENIVAWVLFGCIGFLAFKFGKSTQRIGPLVIGLLLMIYPYFVSDTWLLYGVGIALTAGLFVWKE
jgi:hypothetical protein